MSSDVLTTDTAATDLSSHTLPPARLPVVSEDWFAVELSLAYYTGESILTALRREANPPRPDQDMVFQNHGFTLARRNDDFGFRARWYLKHHLFRLAIRDPAELSSTAPAGVEHHPFSVTLQIQCGRQSQVEHDGPRCTHARSGQHAVGDRPRPR